MKKYYDRAWNPIFGCKGQFTGCDKCFAKTLMKKRNSEYEFTEVSLNHKQYKKSFDQIPELIAVCTQSDLFQDALNDKVRDGVLRKCNKYNNKNYLFLTKYAENMQRYFNDKSRIDILNNNHFNDFSFDNMMFGVTVCTNDDIKRVDFLSKTKMIKHRFIAFEPLYEKINVDANMLENIDWIIIGCETGDDNPHRFDLQWAVALIDAADALNIPVYVNAVYDAVKVGGGIIDDDEDIDILKRKDIPFKKN